MSLHFGGKLNCFPLGWSGQCTKQSNLCVPSVFSFNSSGLKCFGAFSANVMNRLTSNKLCTRIPTCITLSFHTHTWPTSTPPLLTSFHTQLHSHTLSCLPRSHVSYTGEHRGQCDGRIWRKISSFHETTIQCESLVGLKLLPWKQGRFEEAVEVAILPTDMSWVGCTHFF